MLPVQALDKAITEVAKLQRPLCNDEDCDALGIGPHSTEKLREIVATGGLRRNQVGLRGSRFLNLSNSYKGRTPPSGCVGMQSWTACEQASTHMHACAHACMHACYSD